MIFGLPLESVCAGAAVNGQHLDARALGNTCQGDAISMLVIGAGTDFDCDGHLDRIDYRVENATHQRLVGK